MPLRFWRRVKIAPGVTLNLSKTGTSVSLGPRGAKTTIGHGRVRQTLGLPGTGLFYTRTIGQPAAPASQRHAVEGLAVAEPAAVAPDSAGVTRATADTSALPVPWQATIVIMAFLTGIMIAVYPGSAVPFAVFGTPIALLLAWLLRRHPLALLVVVGVAIVAVIAIALEVIVGVLAAGMSGGKSRRRRR